MSLKNFANKIESIPNVVNVDYNEDEETVVVIFKSNPKHNVEKLSEIRAKYPEVKQSNQTTEDENTILTYSC